MRTATCVKCRSALICSRDLVLVKAKECSYLEFWSLPLGQSYTSNTHYFAEKFVVCSFESRDYFQLPVKIRCLYSHFSLVLTPLRRLGHFLVDRYSNTMPKHSIGSLLSVLECKICFTNNCIRVRLPQEVKEGLLNFDTPKERLLYYTNIIVSLLNSLLP